MVFRFFDPNEILLGIRVEQGDYTSLDEMGNPVEELNGGVFTIGLLFVNIHIYFGDLRNGKREE